LNKDSLIYRCAIKVGLTKNPIYIFTINSWAEIE